VKPISANMTFQVIGVAPESFTGSQLLLRSSLYIPLAMAPRLEAEVAFDPISGLRSQQNMLDDRAERILTVQGRLQPGVSASQAAETAVIAQQLTRTFPDTNLTCALVAETDVQSRLMQNPFAVTVSEKQLPARAVSRPSVVWVYSVWHWRWWVSTV